MYADRIEGDSKSTIRDRLNANSSTNSITRHSVTGKRGAPCASFSWEPIASVRLAPHETKLTYKPNPCGIVKWIISKALEVDEIFNNHSKGALPIVLGIVWISKWKGKGGKKTLGLTLSIALEERKLGGGDLRLKLQRKNSQQDTRGGGVRDLRDLLSGSMHLQQVKKDVAKPKPTLDAPKPTRRNVVAESPVADVKKVPSAPSNKKPLQKADASVDGFLQSLGLEKYQITFQAEEVDMTALEHMTDEDLKAMGIPMVWCFTSVLFCCSGPIAGLCYLI
ncbi:hypothetical protein KSS87_017152 [Heliosperma pusillum]|nr:hypothetical protein KSS87_017152 [Heliosperma pusillum]